MNPRMNPTNQPNKMKAKLLTETGTLYCDGYIAKRGITVIDRGTTLSLGGTDHARDDLEIGDGRVTSRLAGWEIAWAPAGPDNQPCLPMGLPRTRRISGEGVLFHNFWGRYSAQLDLECGSPVDAAHLRDELNSRLLDLSPYRDPCFNLRAAGARLASGDPETVVLLVDGDDLPRVRRLFCEWGACPADIDRMVGVDRGPLFSFAAIVDEDTAPASVAA